MKGEDFRDLGHFKPGEGAEAGVWISRPVEMDSDAPFDEAACYRRHGRDVPARVVRAAEERG